MAAKVRIPMMVAAAMEGVPEFQGAVVAFLDDWMGAGAGRMEGVEVSFQKRSLTTLVIGDASSVIVLSVVVSSSKCEGGSSGLFLR